MTEEKVRVRFAPSPTGPLHIGGVRTALYNYLFARKHGGVMILRIEDTDQARFVPGAAEYIMESLAWSGIDIDEGVMEGGEHGPYRQSERKEIYKGYADRLLEKGHAYYAFDTPGELDKLRKDHEAEKKTFTYDSSVRKSLNNSLVLPQEEVERRIAAGEPFVIRYMMPEDEALRFNDLIRGDVTVNTSTLDDKVLFKADGMPTYHLANIVDDHLMKITHVIRGEEWLPSLPLHVLLYRSLGWEAPMFAHLPLLLKPVGSGKLSKRDGDRLGFPVFPLQWQDPRTGDISSGYRESGYFPEAFVNMLALLGWNPGTEQEIFSMDELVQAFSLERVGKSGARFNPDKARWFNHQYLVEKDDTALAELYAPVLEEKGVTAGRDMLLKIVGMVKERADFVSDFWKQSSFFFEAPEAYDEKTVRKRWKEQTTALMEGLVVKLKALDGFSAAAIKAMVENYSGESDVGMGQVMIPLRICLVGGTFGPDLAEIAEILGKDEVIARIDRALTAIG